MKYLLALSLLTLVGCSGVKIINNKEQTFAEYVILNKNSDWKGGNFENLDSDCFPLLRLKKWYEN